MVLSKKGYVRFPMKSGEVPASMQRMKRSANRAESSLLDYTSGEQKTAIPFNGAPHSRARTESFEGVDCGGMQRRWSQFVDVQSDVVFLGVARLYNRTSSRHGFVKLAVLLRLMTEEIPQ